MQSIQTYSIITDKLSQTKLSFLVNNNYIYAVSILVLTIILSRLLVFVIEKVISRLTKKTKTDLDDRLIDAAHKPTYYILIFLGAQFALYALQLESKLADTLSNILFSIVALIVIVLIIRAGKVFLDFWSRVWTKKTNIKIDHDLLPLLKKAWSAVFVIIGSLFILNLWGVNITSFLAGLGIAGIAIGFAVKDSLANVFGGISIILDKNLKRGDKVKLESGEMGTIKDIGIRSTKLLTFDNELIIVPNGILANTRIQNYVLPEPKQRAKINFGVEYGSKPEKVRKIVTDAVKKLEHVMKDPPIEIDFLEMGDSALLFVCKVWVDNYKNAYALKINATEAIYNALNKAKIGIPFPTRTIYTKKG